MRLTIASDIMKISNLDLMALGKYMFIVVAPILATSCGNTIKESEEEKKARIEAETGLEYYPVEKAIEENRTAIFLAEDPSFQDNVGRKFYVATFISEGDTYGFKIFFDYEEGLRYVKSIDPNEAARLAKKVKDRDVSFSDLYDAALVIHESRHK